MICGRRMDVVSQVSLVVQSGRYSDPVRSAECNPNPAYLTGDARVYETERGYKLLVGLGYTCAKATREPLPYDSRPRDRLSGVASELIFAPRMFPIRPLPQRHPRFAALAVGLASIGSARPVRGRQEAIDATAGLLTGLELPFSVPLTGVEPGQAGLIFNRLPIDAAVEADNETLHFRTAATDIAVATIWAALAATSTLPTRTQLTYGQLPGFQGQVAPFSV